jgi:serine phosphatase RsbU (regulator of sigma subunit)
MMPSGVLVAVVDGVGHGQDAARAATRAIAELENLQTTSLIPLVRACHQKLMGSRGAVLSLAFFSRADGTMTWLGVGNVEGVLVRRTQRSVPEHEALLLRGGVVGSDLPSIMASIVPVSCGDVLIFATDGIRSGFASDLKMNGSTKDMAQLIMQRHWRKTDDALVLVARYVHKDEPGAQS